MKKINIVTNFINICLIILLCLLLGFIALLLPYDELWNFQNIFKMYNGFQIYYNCNVIITPLFFYLENIIFHIFGANFLVFRISNIILTLLTFFLAYKLQKQLNINKNINLFFIVLILFSTFSLYYVNGANYNNLALLFYLIGMIIYLTSKNSNILQGIILFLIFFTKQSTAIFYSIAIIIYELYKYRFSKTFFENQIKKLIAFLIPSAFVLLLLFYLNNNLVNFINYTFGGLFDFSNNNLTFDPDFYDLFIIFIAYALSISMFISKKFFISHGFTNDFFEKLLFLIIFSSCVSLTLYPLFNSAHTKIIILLFFIIISFIFNSVFKDFFDGIKMQNIFNIIITLLLLFFTLKTSLEFFFYTQSMELEFITDTSSPYFGICMNKETLDRIETLKDYIKFRNENGIDVIICSYDSALVMIPLRQNHGAYDLIFYGNLGYNGIEKMKKNILSKEHTEFLIVKNEDDMFDQEIIEIREFIMQKLTKCGEILNYDIYSK